MEGANLEAARAIILTPLSCSFSFPFYSRRTVFLLEPERFVTIREAHLLISA